MHQNLLFEVSFTFRPFFFLFYSYNCSDKNLEWSKFISTHNDCDCESVYVCFLSTQAYMKIYISTIQLQSCLSSVRYIEKAGHMIRRRTL